MKSIRNIAFSSLIALGAFGTVTYTACNKDECKDVVCQNGGTCVSGNCSCTVGYEGTNCETQVRTKYYHTYRGTGSDNMGGTYTNSGLRFYKVGDDAKTFGLEVIDNNNAIIVALTVTLQSNTTYNIVQKTDGKYTYTGTGTINENTATATINQHDNVTNETLIVTFTDMNKE